MDDQVDEKEPKIYGHEEIEVRTSFAIFLQKMIPQFEAEVSQGLLYRWTEHSADFFEKKSTGGGKKDRGWTMIFYNLKKITSSSISQTLF